MSIAKYTCVIEDGRQVTVLAGTDDSCALIAQLAADRHGTKVMDVLKEQRGIFEMTNEEKRQREVLIEVFREDDILTKAGMEFSEDPATNLEAEVIPQSEVPQFEPSASVSVLQSRISIFPVPILKHVEISVDPDDLFESRQALLRDLFPEPRWRGSDAEMWDLPVVRIPVPQALLPIEAVVESPEELAAKPMKAPEPKGKPVKTPKVPKCKSKKSKVEVPHPRGDYPWSGMNTSQAKKLEPKVLEQLLGKIEELREKEVSWKDIERQLDLLFSNGMVSWRLGGNKHKKQQQRAS